MTDIRYDWPDGLELLEREIGAQRNGLMNAILMRKEHPTYGYTKAEIRRVFARIEGLLYAWQTITTGFASANFIGAAREAGDALGIDLIDLRNRVEES